MRLFFDLDGTLTDPFEGIANSIEHALGRMGREKPERDSLRRFIGPPLIPSFRDFLGMTEEEAAAALRYYREYFSARGLFENKPYPGIPHALSALREAGHTLCVATSKPEPFAKKILEHFGLAEYFREICGATLDETRTAKGDVIRELLRRLPEDGDPVFMIGDRRHDAEGAAPFGIPTVGVLWGYGPEEELREAGCVGLVSAPEELVQFVESKR